MLLDMAPGSVTPASFQRRCQTTAILLLIVCATFIESAPTTYDEIEAKQTDLSEYLNDPNGCYYNYQHYEEGDRIVTNEPCLNCTCHNRMLMCYLRVCPFSKAIGQDCTVQKSPDQCCPTISCPEVPVHLLTSSTTQTPTTTTEIGWHDNYGCMMNEDGFFPDGAQVPSNPKKPCELCYCIRNRTACVMQECTLHVEGCRPVYEEGVCCPVRYDCDYESEKSTTSAPQITGGLVFSTTSAPFDCRVNDDVYMDGESIAMVSDKPCEHCYCMRGDIVCAVQDCGEPLRGKDCTPETPPAGQCCPTSYQCANETISSDEITTLQPVLLSDSDENEAEKYPTNEDVYNKLGEHQPGQQDDTNDVDPDNVYTTQANYNDAPPAGTSSNQIADNNEAPHSTVPDSHNETGEPNGLPASDVTNKINEENKLETSSVKPELADQAKPTGPESDQTNTENTSKPVEPSLVDEAQPTQSPVADPSSNENAVSSTTQTIAGETISVNINAGDDSPVKNPNQDDLASNLPAVTTEYSIGTETQSPNLQDKPQEEVQEQTISPAEDEKEPLKSNNDAQRPEATVDIKPQTETASNEQKYPTKQINEESTESYSGDDKIQTSVPLSEDTEQTTQKLAQDITEKDPSKEPNAQTDIEQDSPDQNNQDVTQIPQEDISQTENPSILNQNLANNNKPQEENISTDVPNRENEPTNQNNLPVENQPQAGNQPESEKLPSEQNQDSPLEENVSSTEVPKVENQDKPQEDNVSPTEVSQVENQNKPQEDNVAQTEVPKVENQDKPQEDNVSPTEVPNVENQDKPQEDNISPTAVPNVDNQDKPQEDNVSSTEVPNVENQDKPQEDNVSPTEVTNIENQDKPQEDNVSPTEVPKGENQDKLQEDILSPTVMPGIENEPNEQNKPVEETNSQTENASPTEIPKVENDLAEQNIPSIESSTQANNQPEYQTTPTEQKQDNPQVENVSSTEIPKVENDPTQENKPVVEGNLQVGSLPESDETSTEVIKQDDSQSENELVTEIPKVENNPSEQNTPLEEKIPQIENRPESDSKLSGQNNQDGTVVENLSPTDIPKVENEPTEQNKPLKDSIPQTESQSELQTKPAEQNQDSPLMENVSPTEIPKVENEPIEQSTLVAENNIAEIQPESQTKPAEQIQDSPQMENVSPTEIPKVENEPVEQSTSVAENNVAEIQPETQTKPAEQIQDSPQVENVSPTEIPKVENEPVEQGTPVVENDNVEIQPESQTKPTEQNQDSPQVENVSSTETPKVENKPIEQSTSVAESDVAEVQPESQTKPAEQIQDSPQVENVSPTEIPKVENEPVEQSTPVAENNIAEIQPESQTKPTEQNQDSPQVENITPTEIPKVENEPVEHSTPVVENNIAEVQPESATKLTEQSQDSPQVENITPTEIPKVENEPVKQNTPVMESNSQAEDQPESQTKPTEQNQDNPQEENGSPTEFPKVENEPVEQNTPLIENNPQTENQHNLLTKPTEQTHDSSQVPDESQTEIPSKLNDQKTEIAGTENASIKPAEPIVPENDAPTEPSIEDNNIFVVSPTSPPLFSQNQVKGEESSSVSSENDNSDKFSSTEKNEVEKLQPSSDDKPSPAVNPNSDSVSSVSATEAVPESNNASPQTNDGITEHSTETKPIVNEVNSDVTSSPISSNEPASVSDEHNDNRFGSNKPSSSEPELAPTTETNYDPSSELANQGVLVDDSSSQENQPTDEGHNVSVADSIENQDAPQTEVPTEVEASTNAYPPSADQHENDVTTSLPQQQIVDNNIPAQPEVSSPGEPTKTQDEAKPSNNLPENNTPEKSSDNNSSTESSGTQNSDETSQSTELPVLNNDSIKQSFTTQAPEQNSELENVTPLVQSQNENVNENVNEIVEKTTVYPDTSSDDKNTLSTVTENNENILTPLSDKIQTGTNTQVSSDSSAQNEHKDAPEIVSTAPIEQVNPENSENSDSVDNVVTTNSYDETPSVVPTTNSPANQADENEGSLPVNPSTNIETSVSNDFVPLKVNSEETSTLNFVDDTSTNKPIQESPVLDVNSNDEGNTNVPSNSEILNEVNQDSSTESEQYTTHYPTFLSVDSNKTPANDVTMESISNLPEQTNATETSSNGVNEQSTGSPQNVDKPSASVTPDNAIDITTTSPYESQNSVSDPTKIVDQDGSISEVTTFNNQKDSDVVTEAYENVQPGVPGEGSCLIEFVTYAHKAEVPKSNPCHEKCECLNSIVTCTSVNCPPAPPQHRNCIPLHPGNESWCCPTYMCDGGIEGMLFNNDNQQGSSPQLISTVVLEDKPNEENDQTTPLYEEIPSTSSPQIALEYNTLAPLQTDINSDVNSQNAIGESEVPTQTEISNQQVGDSVVTNEEVNNSPVTTAGVETTEISNSNENDKPSENEKPLESENPSESNKPVESDQPTENEKPIDDSEADVTTVPSYVADVQTATNKPETSNNIEEQNKLSNASNESQDSPAPSTELPNYESTEANVLPSGDQNQPPQSPESDYSPSVTTFKPSDSVVDQQVNDNQEGGAEKPITSEESDTKLAVGVTDVNNISPIEVTETPTIFADAKPSSIENNAGGLRPSSIDDIISSVNMVKDAVKNSLETSSKPAEIDYQTTYGAVESYQPTVLPVNEPANPQPEDSSPDKINDYQTTVSSVNVVPESPQTGANDEKSPENNVASDPAYEVGTTQAPYPSPSANADQGVSTDLPAPAVAPEKPEVADRPEEAADDKTPEATTLQNLLIPAAQDSTGNGPETSSDSALSQVQNSESSATQSGPAANEPSDVTTQASPGLTQQEPAKEQDPKPDAEGAVPAVSDDRAPAEVSTQTATGSQSSTDYPSAGVSDASNDNRFGSPSSSPSSVPVIQEDHDDRPQEADDQAPTSSDKPASNAALAPHQQPAYTPIPQSSWTQKPFHHDSTSEAPAQTDQGFPDEYEDENDAVYGPGTCRYGGKVYVSAQQVPRDDPCDFCFCFRGDIICLQQSCPPPIFGCYQENIQGFCCPRYECPVAQATSVNVTTTTTTTTTAVPPHFFANAYRGAARRAGCLIHGHAYRVGEDVGIASGPCLECICGADGKMKCDPKPCSPEPMLRKMMAEAVEQRRKR